MQRQCDANGRVQREDFDLVGAHIRAGIASGVVSRFSLAPRSVPTSSFDVMDQLIVRPATLHDKPAVESLLHSQVTSLFEAYGEFQMSALL